MNNLLSYCGLIDEKIRASDKDLPVQAINNYVTPFLGHGTEQRELTPEEREKARQKLHKNWNDAEEAKMGTGNVFIWILPISSLLPSQYLRNFWRAFFCSSSIN